MKAYKASGKPEASTNETGGAGEVTSEGRQHTFGVGSNTSPHDCSRGLILTNGWMPRKASGCDL